jgi:hypothetical protein
MLTDVTAAYVRGHRVCKKFRKKKKSDKLDTMKQQ